MKRHVVAAVVLLGSAAALVAMSCELLVPAHVSCDAGVCAPDVPDGWTGPVVVYLGSSTDLSEAGCPSDLPNAIDGFHDLAWDAATCGFTCDPPSNADCSAQLEFYHPNICGDLDASSPVICSQVSLTSGCVNVNDCDAQAGSAIIATNITQGTCDNTHLHVRFDAAAAPTWGGAIRICSSGSLAACSGVGCVTAPPGFHGPCVYAAGASGCPSGSPYAQPMEAYLGDGGWVDDRDCGVSSAACGAPVGASCSGTLFYRSAVQISGCDESQTFAGNTCIDSGAITAAQVAIDLDAGSCATSGAAEPIGSVTPTSAAVLVCCTQ